MGEGLKKVGATVAKPKKKVKDVEAKAGKKDSIRGFRGENVYGNMNVETFMKRFEKQMEKMELPAQMPTQIIFVYPDGQPNRIISDVETVKGLTVVCNIVIDL